MQTFVSGKGGVPKGGCAMSDLEMHQESDTLGLEETVFYTIKQKKGALAT